MIRRLAALLLLAGCVDTALPGDAPATGTPTTGKVAYRCDGGKTLDVTYQKTGDDASILINVDGPETLLEEPSETGRRFAWPSDGSYHVWEVNGASGTLSFRDGEQGTTTPVLTNCRA